MNLRTVFKRFGEFDRHFESFQVPDSCWALVLRASAWDRKPYPPSDKDMSPEYCLLGSYQFSNVLSTSSVHQGILEIDETVDTLGDFEQSASETGVFILWSDSPFAIVLSEDRPVGRGEMELHISRQFEAGVFLDESLPLNEVLGLLNTEYQRGNHSMLRFLVSKAQPTTPLSVQS